jgi:predicted phage tail protein
VGSLQTYEYSLPPVKKAKTIALKASKKKARVSSEEDSDNEEDAVAMLAKNFGRLMKNDKFKKKFTKRLKKTLREFEPEEAKRRIQEVPNVLSAQALGIFRLTVGISAG